MCTNDGTINRPAAPRILPVFWSIITDSTSRFLYVLEVSPKKNFVLLYVKPEIENIVGAISMKKLTAAIEMKQIV